MINSLFGRANVLFVNFALSAALIGLLTAGTDFLEEPKHPDVSMNVDRVLRFGTNKRNHDQVVLDWRVDADLSSLWTWNTHLIFAFVQAEYETELNKVNQVSLHDVIMTSPKKAKLRGKMRQEYEFVDQGRHLRDTPLNLTLTWCIMPKIGLMKTQFHTVAVGKLPDQYSLESQQMVSV